MKFLKAPFVFIYKYFLQVYEEGRKSVWPTRQIVINGTVTVSVTVVIAVLIFAGFDWLVQTGLVYLIER